MVDEGASSRNPAVGGQGTQAVGCDQIMAALPKTLSIIFSLVDVNNVALVDGTTTSDFEKPGG